MPMKTYFTFTMVQTSVATLEFNTIKKINTTTLSGPQQTRRIQTNNSKILSKVTTLMKRLMKIPKPMKEYI